MIEPIASRVREIVRSGGCDAAPGEVADLLSDLQRVQGLRVAPVEGAPEELNPVPEAAFKLMTIAHFGPSEARLVFRTSGTTTGSPGRHLVLDPDLARDAALRGFERFVLYGCAPKRCLSLVPPFDERPTSSLSFMISAVLETFGVRGRACVRRGKDLDLAGAGQAFRDAIDAGEPLVLLGTSLDFLTLFDALAEPVRLPAGSRAMHTGGAKASGRAVDRAALRAAFVDRLGIEADDVVEEFGMTELTSQSYDAPRVSQGPRRFVSVPWMRSRVVDPRTLDEVEDGRRGLLLHEDLANCWTAAALLSSDLATRVGDGFADVVRAPGAPARGCSSEASTGTTR